MGGAPLTRPLWSRPSGSLAAPAGSDGPERPPARASRWWALGWVVPLVLQLVHAAVVAPTYHVGSFDDDANYLMAAHVLAHGGWLTSTMPSGSVVVANYLPGYPLLLVPLVWVFGGALWPPRLFSTLCIAALYPLLWSWMGRRGVRPSYRVGVLGLLAMNLVVATYATMVMAEAPFMMVLVLVLFVLDRWSQRPGWKWAAVEVVLLAELVWLKEAGIGLVAGLVIYLLWRRRWGPAAGVTLGTAALLLPGLSARWLTGGATVGDRYVGEISNSGQGGLLHQLPTEIKHDLWSYLRNVLHHSVLPLGSPLPSTGPVHLLVTVVGYTVPVFSVLGAVVWYRRHPMPELWMVGAYFIETLGYPFTNQRRVILVLPLVTMWYVMGACVAGRAVLTLSGRVSGRAMSRVAISAAVVVAVLAAEVPTAFGFTTNYLYRAGQQSSEFAGSPAMWLLKAIGPPSAVVETDYRGSVAYFTDHRTAWTAFTTTTPYGPFAGQNQGSCTRSRVKAALAADDAHFLIVGDFNIPGLMDSPCLLHMASSSRTAGAIGAHRLLSSDHDDTSVFELLGPGTPQPSLVDRTAAAPSSGATAVTLPANGQGDSGGTAYTVRAVDGEATFHWTWARPEPLSQVSVGTVTAPAGKGGAAPVTAASVSIDLGNGKWRTVARADGPVGDDGAAPYFLAGLPSGTMAVGLEVSARTTGEAEVSYVNAIGPTSRAASRT